MPDTPPAPDPVALLTMSDLSERWALSIRAIQKIIRRGDLPAVRFGRSVRIDPADARAYVERQKGARQV